MGKLPNYDDFDNAIDWVEAISDSTRIEENILWEIIEQLKPGLQKFSLSLKDSEKASKLKSLFEIHMKRLWEGEGGKIKDVYWIKIYFPFEGKIGDFYEFNWGEHNLLNLTKEMEKLSQKIIKEEGLEIAGEMDTDNNRKAIGVYSEGVMDVEEMLRITYRILNEVYEINIEEIEQAIEVSDSGKELYWSDI